MENLLFISFDTSTVLGIIFGSVVILPIIFLILSYFVFAPRNIFFTFGKENRAMFIMLGNKFSGKVILPSNTMYADANYNIHLFGSEKEKREFMQKSFLGMYWIGMYPFYNLYNRRQQWQEWELTKDENQIIKLRDELTPYLITTPFEYAMVLKAGEDKGKIPLDVAFTVIVEPINLVRPIFDNENAYGQLQRFSVTEALLFVKQQTFETLGASVNGNDIDHQNLRDKFSEQICSLNQLIPGRQDKMGLEKSIGYRILSAKINTVDVVGDNKEAILKATTAKYVAEQEKLAQLEKADGEAGSMDKIIEAQDRRNKIFEGKPEATAIKISENIRDSKLTTLVTNSGVMPTLDLTKKS